ncbi:hypothetical protein [Streptomyces sp. OE57]|uniref:hypothetical protein n=1 Tax=Streptomyces lacaronensis TaxID=3379885 RepID=UPI0039B73121
MTPAALDDLGIRPDVAYAARSPLLHAHRAARDVAYHFFANGSATEAVDHEVAIASPWAKATPYPLGAWTGEVGPVAVHRGDGTLAPGATALVALARGAGPVHAISTDAEAARFTDGVLEVVDTRPGARETMLSEGRWKFLARIGELSAPLVLDRWSLWVADCRPGSSPDCHVTVDHRLDLGALAAWPDISGLEDVSGVGRYRTTVRLGCGWTGATGTRHALGRGLRTPAGSPSTAPRWAPWTRRRAWWTSRGLLRHGENTIEVEVAATLLNRLRTVRPAEFRAAERQRYGLVGPVRLVPYGRAVVSDG